MTRYEWVVSRKAEGFPTNKACQVAGVSTSAFNDWRLKVAAGPTDVSFPPLAGHMVKRPWWPGVGMSTNFGPGVLVNFGPTWV